MFDNYRFLTLDFLEVTTIAESEFFNCRGGARMKTTSDVLKQAPKGTIVNVTIEDFILEPEGGRAAPITDIYRQKININIVYHGEEMY
jgi:hypothetical protein